MLYNYEAKVVKVVDGDTVDLLIDLGFKVFHEIRVRLAEINSAEMKASDATEKKYAADAKKFLADLVDGKKVIFQSHGKDKYGRWIAEIFLPENKEKSVSKMILEAGMARTYDK